MSVAFSQSAQTRAESILKRYPDKQAAVIQLLHLAQEEFGHLSQEIEKYIGELTGVPATFVHQVATFYGMFHFQPVGRYHIKVCESIACHLMGATTVIDYLQEKLGIKVGQTTPDGKFTLSTVECLGACELAPMMQINDDFYGPLDEKTIDEIMTKLK